MSTSSISSLTGASSTSGASFTGLSSGIDTDSLIKRLMELETKPQDRLKSRLVQNSGRSQALTDIRTQLSSLVTSMGDLALGSSLRAQTATWTGGVGAVTTTGSAAATSLPVTRTVLAVAQRAEFTGNGSTASGWMVGSTLTGDSDGTFPVTIQANGATTPVTVKAQSYSASDVAAAVNASGAGVSAAVITGDDGVAHLVMTAASGDYSAQGGFSLTLSNGGTPVVSGTWDDPTDAVSVAGADAQIVIGGVMRSSKSNTFTDVVPGLSLTLTATSSTPSTITVADDRAAAAKNVAGLVKQVSSLLSTISFHTTPPAGGGQASFANGGVLGSDAGLRTIAQQLMNVITGVTAVSADPDDSITAAGVSVSKGDYSPVVDESVLAAFLSSNPAAAQRILTGLGTAVQKVATAASGTVSEALSSAQGNASTLTKQISEWDDRLAKRQAALKAQYTAMETALSKIKLQSDALTQALKSLDTSKS